MFVWTSCSSCGCQCGASSVNAPKTALTAWGNSTVVLDMKRPLDSANICTSWTTFAANSHSQNICDNCSRSIEEHHGAKSFCFPYFLFGKCCSCCESDGHIGTLFVETYGCVDCRRRIRANFERRRREEEKEAETRRADAQKAMARAEIEKVVALERKQRQEAFELAKRQAQDERAGREKEHFAPLDWLRSFVEEVAPKPTSQLEEQTKGEYLRLQGRGVAEQWWGWHADDPPSHLM